MKEYLDVKDFLRKLVHRLTQEDIYVGNYSARAKQINSSLTTSSGDDAWLKATIAAICQDYPGVELGIFRGYIGPNSQGYFEIQIYNTTTTHTSGLPQYCHGTWRKWQNVFWVISTNNYAFSYAAK